MSARAASSGALAHSMSRKTPFCARRDCRSDTFCRSAPRAGSSLCVDHDSDAKLSARPDGSMIASYSVSRSRSCGRVQEQRRVPGTGRRTRPSGLRPQRESTRCRCRPAGGRGRRDSRAHSLRRPVQAGRCFFMPAPSRPDPAPRCVLTASGVNNGRNCTGGGARDWKGCPCSAAEELISGRPLTRHPARRTCRPRTPTGASGWRTGAAGRM